MVSREEVRKTLYNIHQLQLQCKQMQCPCCGRDMAVNAKGDCLSRYHEVYICLECSMKETDSGATPLKDWAAIKNLERGYRTIEKAMADKGNGVGPGVVIVKDKNDAMVGVLLVKNADKYLSDCVEDIEANWILMRESYLERAQEDKDFLFDEDAEHLAYVEAQLKLCVSDDAEHTPYEVENLENVCVVEAN